jgi:hypothetical protein
VVELAVEQVLRDMLLFGCLSQMADCLYQLFSRHTILVDWIVRFTCLVYL